eukprot:Em0007g496a
MQVVFINYDESPNMYGRVCTAIGLLQLYTEWTKLFFTMWATFHLFYFAVLHKNLKNFEVLYVVTSLLVPALIAIVPLVTHAYGLSPVGEYCYIYANTSVAFIERLALWDGPAMLMLIAVSTAMVAMVIKLASQVCRRSKYEPITDGDQFWKALKQLLPLATFPLLFFIFEIPVFLYHVYTTQHSTPNEGMLISVIAAVNGVSVLVCLLAAIFVLRLKLYKTLVYRLALYQVLSALVMSSIDSLQTVFINYDESPDVYLCCLLIERINMHMEPEQETENRSARSGASKRKKRKEQLDEWNKLQSKLPRLLSFGFHVQNEPNHSTLQGVQAGNLETAVAEHQCVDVVDNVHDSMNETEPSATMLPTSSDPCSSSQSSRPNGPIDECVPISMLQAPLDVCISVHSCDTSCSSSQSSQSYSLETTATANTVNDPAKWTVTDNLREYWALHGPTRCHNNDGRYTASKRKDAGGLSRMVTENMFKRILQNGDTVSREWLIYSPSIGCLFCFVCKLFGKSKSALADKGFDDWKHAGVRLSEHEHSSEHTSAMLAFCSRRKNIERIDSSLQIQFDNEVKYWRNVLKRVVHVITFLSERGLAFRGDNEIFGSQHNGNYLGILELISNFDPFLSDHIARFGNAGNAHLSDGDRLATLDVFPLMGIDLFKSGYVIQYCSLPELNWKVGRPSVSRAEMSEERTVVGILKRAVSTSPDKLLEEQLSAFNSVHNTCVFCCFEAGDSVTNLHVALDRFKDQVEHLHGMKWRQYTVKIFMCGDYEFLSKMYGLSGASGCYPRLFCIIGSDEMATPLSIRGFSKYSQELQNLSLLQAELEKAQQSHEELQNMATYMALVNGEKSPLAVKLVKQSAAKMKSVTALLPNVKTQCTAISQMAQEKLLHRSGEVAENMKNFIYLFSLFGKCHNISDQNFIDEPQIHALDQAIEEFMAFFQQQQSQSKCT